MPSAPIELLARRPKTRSSSLALLLAPALAAIPAAASCAPSRTPMAQLDDAASAEARYREWHRTTLAPNLSAPDRKRADGLLARPPRVERAGCCDAREVAAGAGEGVAAHGAVAALDRAGECWLLRWDGLLGLGLGAVVARDGEVLLVWWIPEG